MNSANNTIYIGTCYMADGSPMPELLTEEETIKFLRLDIDGPEKPELTLKYYRDQGLLKACRVGKHLRYQKKELLKFLDLLTERTNDRHPCLNS
jgi:hypothetical protein